MSTRTRVILLLNGDYYCHGSTVSKCLIKEVLQKKKFRASTLRRYERMSKREKLMFLARKMKPSISLLIFQEPRRTRLSKSLYWKHIKDSNPQAANPGVPQQVRFQR